MTHNTRERGLPSRTFRRTRDTTPHSATRALVAITLVLTALLVPSCTRVVQDGHPVAAEHPSAQAETDNPCTPVDAPLTVISTDADEPVLKIPQPKGWTRFTEMDSEIVRFAMRSESAGAIAVVTAESMDGVGDPADAFEGVHDGLRQVLGTDAEFDVTPTEHCGLPAEIVPFVNPGMGAVGRMPTEALTVVMVRDGTTHVISLQVAKKRPNDPVAARDADTILTGFQVLPPSN